MGVYPCRVQAEDQVGSARPITVRRDVSISVIVLVPDLEADRPLPSSSKIVRHGIARAIAAIADHDLYTPSGAPSSSTTPSSNQWPDLIPFLTQTCQSANATHREAAIFVLYTVLDTVRDNFINDMMTGMFQIFGTTLADQDGDVRLITLRALGKIAEYIESDQKDLVVSR